MAKKTRNEPPIADRDEILRLLTEQARNGSTGAMIALERALRARDKLGDDDLNRELDRILTK